MSKDTDFDSNKKAESSLDEAKQLTAAQRLERIENALIYSSQCTVAYGNYETDEDEIDLGRLLSIIWNGKFKIIAIALLIAIFGLLYALSLPNIYTSTLKLVPAQQESEGGLSSLAAKYGGLASMAGINLGGGDSGNNIEHAVELMNSWPYVETFVEKYNLKTTFMAANGWDASTNQLKFDINKFDKDKNQWVQDSGLFSSDLESLEPTSFETYKAIKKDFFSISFDDELGIFNISVNHFSPYVAYEMANKLKNDINEYFRAQDKKQALDSISFIEDKINSTANSQMREVFYNMIESHTQKIMMTEISDEYLLKTLIPAKVSEPKEKSKPKRAIIVIVSFILGGMLGALLVLISAFRNSKEV
ncbi:Wzz/FepE/Etk N-terminal domain-containing protein [Psychrosphaera haliotis]|uniref:Wzz/FepE/Etk N-terminal domain-containing protein n=1 Tax=Psychrosphaera haliotis TaxID=555083 RepID=UPI00236AEA4B|nr:Wzz/FepE/Etk N-terminal domain-containing protein [Psychrosphaera haliotis]